jgi:N-ethylmaleimide reductase
MAADLFTPISLGGLQLPNRIVMAPLTRNRAGQPGNVAQPINATYYAQRASAGLIITEGSPISEMAHGYPGTPGIHSPAQVAGWKRVTDTVHAKGGRIFLQLWHVGRISHPTLLPNDALSGDDGVRHAACAGDLGDAGADRAVPHCGAQCQDCRV